MGASYLISNAHLKLPNVAELVNEDLQDYVKEHNLVFRKLSLQEQLRRKRIKNVQALKSRRKVCNQISNSIHQNKTTKNSNPVPGKEQEDDQDSIKSSESEIVHVVKILGHRKTAKNGFMFHLKFSDDTSDWSTYECAMTDCATLMREYMLKNQKVTPKQTKSVSKVSSRWE